MNGVNMVKPITLTNGRVLTHEELVNALIREEKQMPERAEALAQILESGITADQLKQYVKETKQVSI